MNISDWSLILCKKRIKYWIFLIFDRVFKEKSKGEGIEYRWSKKVGEQIKIRKKDIGKIVFCGLKNKRRFISRPILLISQLLYIVLDFFCHYLRGLATIYSLFSNQQALQIQNFIIKKNPLTKIELWVFISQKEFKNGIYEIWNFLIYLIKTSRRWNLKRK